MQLPSHLANNKNLYFHCNEMYHLYIYLRCIYLYLNIPHNLTTWTGILGGWYSNQFGWGFLALPSDALKWNGDATG